MWADRLINYSELRITFKLAPCFTAPVDDVIIHDKRDVFFPSIWGFQVLHQADEEFRIPDVATNVADFVRTAVQRAGQMVFFILSRRYYVFYRPHNSQSVPILRWRWISTSSTQKNGRSALYLSSVCGMPLSFQLCAVHGCAGSVPLYATQACWWQLALADKDFRQYL